MVLFPRKQIKYIFPCLKSQDYARSFISLTCYIKKNIKNIPPPRTSDKWNVERTLVDLVIIRRPHECETPIDPANGVPLL